jgi:hypothetical protein
MVVDVRPADRVGPEDAVKFAATEAMCQEMGCWTYALVHEPDPVAMANVRWLAGYRHPRHRIQDVCSRLLEAFGELRLLMAGVEETGDPIAVLPVLFHLLWCGDLGIELEAPLADDSMVRPSGAGQP